MYIFAKIRVIIKFTESIVLACIYGRSCLCFSLKVKNALLNAWDGLTVKEAQAKKVDGVTGATFTSEAIKENVQKGLDYYQKNK